MYHLNFKRFKANQLTRINKIIISQLLVELFTEFTTVVVTFDQSTTCPLDPLKKVATQVIIYECFYDGHYFCPPWTFFRDNFAVPYGDGLTYRRFTLVAVSNIHRCVVNDFVFFFFFGGRLAGGQMGR